MINEPYVPPSTRQEALSRLIRSLREEAKTVEAHFDCGPIPEFLARAKTIEREIVFLEAIEESWKARAEEQESEGKKFHSRFLLEIWRAHQAGETYEAIYAVLTEPEKTVFEKVVEKIKANEKTKGFGRQSGATGAKPTHPEKAVGSGGSAQAALEKKGETEK